MKYMKIITTAIATAENITWSGMPSLQFHAHPNHIKLITCKNGLAGRILMKIAFVADTHFGYSRFEQDASAQGRAALLGAAAKADVLLLGGDIFDIRIPKLETLAEAAECLQDAKKILDGKNAGRIRGAGLVLGIHGTHERRGKDSLNPVQMLSRLGLLIDLHNRTEVLECGGKKFAFSGMGGIPDDLVSDALRRLSCKIVDGAENFFLFHQTMKEFVPQATDVASIDELPEGYGWYLCGHIHSRHEYMGGKLLIPGSTVLTQLRDDEMDAKGYYIIDTDGGKAEFVMIESRPYFFIKLEFDKAPASEAREKILQAIAEAVVKNGDGAKPIVRVKVSGTLASGAAIDMSGFEREDAFVFVDSQADGGTLGQELENLRERRMHKATPYEIGAAKLRENAKNAGISAERADELFQKFLGES